MSPSATSSCRSATSYELAVLSYLYAVYGRGGYLLAPVSRSAPEQSVGSFRLRDSE